MKTFKELVKKLKEMGQTEDWYDKNYRATLEPNYKKAVAQLKKIRAMFKDERYNSFDLLSIIELFYSDFELYLLYEVEDPKYKKLWKKLSDEVGKLEDLAHKIGTEEERADAYRKLKNRDWTKR